MSQFFVQGLFSGVYYYAFKLDPGTPEDPAAPFDSYVFKVKQLIDDAVAAASQDSIVSLVYFPFDYSGEADQTVSSDVYPAATRFPVKYDHIFARPSRVGSYTPRNKKLLSFPYNFFTVNTLDGSKEYRYEWFTYASEENPTFTVKTVGSLSSNPEIACVPVNYRTVTGENWQEEIILAGFPQLAFTIDTYRAWVAQHALQTGLSMAVPMLAGGFAGAAGAAAAGVAGVGAFNSVVSSALMAPLGMSSNIAGMVRDLNKADSVRGSTGGSVEAANEAKAFYFKNSHITEEYARMIDDYFDKFGYACCRVQRPNIHARSRWTYVKTREASLAGRIPSDDLQKIQQIFDSGITFWSDLIHTGDYSFAANEELN